MIKIRKKERKQEKPDIKLPQQPSIFTINNCRNFTGEKKIEYKMIQRYKM